MKLLNFERAGKQSWGLLNERGIVDLGALSGARVPTLRAVLASNSLVELAQQAEGRAADLAFDEVRHLPVITEPQKIFCIGLNYEAHRVEANRPKTGQPAIFVRTPTSQVGPGEPLIVPNESASLNYKGKLSIVIGSSGSGSGSGSSGSSGSSGRRIAEADAWSFIAGYAAYNDGSVREWQQHTTQWTPSKNFDATAAFGPWLVTGDEIADDAGNQRRHAAERRRNAARHDAHDDLQHSVSDLVPLTFRDFIAR